MELLAALVTQCWTELKTNCILVNRRNRRFLRLVLLPRARLACPDSRNLHIVFKPTERAYRCISHERTCQHESALESDDPEYHMQRPLQIKTTMT